MKYRVGGLPGWSRGELLGTVENLNRWLKKAEYLYGILEVNSSKTASLERRVASLEKSTDSSKREHITILGIFAAIVVAFTAGVSFSGSALQNIGNATPYKLGLVLMPMALFLLDLVGLLIVFLIEMVGNVKKKPFYITLCVGNALFVALFWLDIAFGRELGL